MGTLFKLERQLGGVPPLPADDTSCAAALHHALIKKNKNLSSFTACDRDVYIFHHKFPLSPRAVLAGTPDLELRLASLDKLSSSLWWSLKLSSTRP